MATRKRTEKVRAPKGRIQFGTVYTKYSTDDQEGTETRLDYPLEKLRRRQSTDEANSR